MNFFYKFQMRIIIHIFSFFCLSLFSSTLSAQSGYEISVLLKPYKSEKIFLGGYLGKSTVVFDSVFINEKSKGVFKGEKKLTPGIYFIISPSKTILFDLLIGADQYFSINADTTDLATLTFSESFDNTINQEYGLFMSGKMKTKQSLSEQYAKAKSRKDSLAIVEQYKAIESEEKAYQERIIKQYPDSLISFLFISMQRPTPPKVPISKGKPDSLYPYRFVKDHFWDGVLFSDDRLLRTPFFEPKLDDYFKYYVAADPDSIIGELNYILHSAKAGKDIYAFLLTKFTNKYMRPEYMGQDKVFVYIFENFYAKGDTILLNPDSRKIITERAYSLMANLLGKPAPPLNLTDTTGHISALYGLQSPFTFIAYWDPSCGHCKEEIPRLDSIYRKRWKSLGVQVYSIKAEGASLSAWKQFIRDHNLSSDWKQVYETDKARLINEKAGKAGLRQLYDFNLTPSYYLLDREKRIIAKKLSLEQFTEIINSKNKK